MNIDRRTALGLLGLGVSPAKMQAAQAHMHAIGKNMQAPYTLQFFSEAENRLLDRVAEMILPADDHSPGAHEAQVSHYIDLIAANSGEKQRADWKRRLAAFEGAARNRFGASFLELRAEQQAGLMDAMAAAEARPPDDAGRFFVDVKKATLFAYYSSPVGLLRELEYAGNKEVAQFAGCGTTK